MTICNICFITLLRSTKTFPRGPDTQRRRRKLNMFLDATAFQAKFTCTNAVTGPPNSCTCTKCIPDASWHVFVSECLAEAPVTGECTEWASGKPYGTMPNWDTSLVTDMSGWTGSAHKGFGGKSTFNADISKWDTGKVSKMNQMFYQASAFNQDIGSWNTAQVTDMRSMFNSRFCVQPRHWELEHRESDYYGSYVSESLLRSTKTLGVGTRRK